jgi:hypothetical protein
MDLGRRHRARERGPRLDQPADLAAGHAAATDKPPVPDGLDWDLWIGPSPMRPYHTAYHPFSWRSWMDFGSWMDFVLTTSRFQRD